MERKIKTTPLALPRTRRRDEWRGLTSCRAGQIVPVAFFPLLREDAIRGRISIGIRMAEAIHPIINRIRVRAQAHLIPKSALARFDGSLEVLNRSFMGQTLPGGGAAPAWDVLDTSLAAMGDDDKGHEIYDKLGLHYKSTTAFNTDLVESYWTMVNWRRASVSKALGPISVTETKLAPAFWDHWKFDPVKPSFDAAMMEGTVPVGIDGSARVTQYGYKVAAEPSGTNGAYNFVGRDGSEMPSVVADNVQNVVQKPNQPLVVTLDESTGASISLANIATATQTRRFAELRQQYQGIPDEYLIDMLMRGLRVPPEDFREPVLLGMTESMIGQVERYATDGENLDQSVTRGMASLSMPINTPAVATGGIVLVTIEIVPEQLYERIDDLFMAVKPPETLPDALRDLLDPQKVEVVENRYADSFHTAPDGVFGYAPLNFQWQRAFARVGGRFKRPVPDAFVEDRQRIWAVEKADPALSEDFYICPDPFPHTVFADADADPFEVTVIGSAMITGLTQFGAGFEEDDDHYEKIMEQLDLGRIESVPPATSAGAVSDTGDAEGARASVSSTVEAVAGGERGAATAHAVDARPSRRQAAGGQADNPERGAAASVDGGVK